MKKLLMTLCLSLTLSSSLQAYTDEWEQQLTCNDLQDKGTKFKDTAGKSWLKESYIKEYGKSAYYMQMSALCKLEGLRRQVKQFNELSDKIDHLEQMLSEQAKKEAIEEVEKECEMPEKLPKREDHE